MLHFCWMHNAEMSHHFPEHIITQSQAVRATPVRLYYIVFYVLTLMALCWPSTILRTALHGHYRPTKRNRLGNMMLRVFASIFTLVGSINSFVINFILINQFNVILAFFLFFLRPTSFITQHYRKKQWLVN